MDHAVDMHHPLAQRPQLAAAGATSDDPPGGHRRIGGRVMVRARHPDARMEEVPRGMQFLPLLAPAHGKAASILTPSGTHAPGFGPTWIACDQVLVDPIL